MKKTTQKRVSRSHKLLKHLLSGKTINGRQALTRFGIYRLSAFIFNWRKKGFTIDTKMVKRQGSTYAVYTLTGTPTV